ncbi:MAG TPA: glycoside hydrolase family 92 protein, partial [Protaetiibacter sp.]|nr:glycoside hydrolase family 92 protein [Protaetiibacter sp.]
AATIPSPHEPDPLRGYYSLVISGARFEARPSDEGLVIEVREVSAPVRVELGGSLISSAQAEYARSEIAGRSIDEVADAAGAAWEEALGIVDSVSAPSEHRALLAADLYRLFLYPTRHHEDTPDGPRYVSPLERTSADTPHVSGRRVRSGRLLTNNGFWDTYRTAWPAFHLLAPARAGELLDGMLEHVREGGWSPRWTAGTSLDAMVGTSLDVIAADAVAAGVSGVDVETAYTGALRNATAASSDARFGRKGTLHALARGYAPASIPESVSWTIEGAINDAGAAVLARELARTAGGTRAARLHTDARYLAHRAAAYRSLWDGGTRFFRPRHADGSWADEPFDPRVWGGAHTETNAWGSRFPAPHDGVSLSTLFGGEKAFGEALDAYFVEAETAEPRFAGSYGEPIHEMFEARDIRRGMWAVSNQPAHHVPWMYAFSDRPWRTSEILHDAVHRLFRGSRIGQGFPGDEDNGEMSAWHLFAQLGFAPFQPGSGRLLITAPTRPSFSVRPLGAERLDIVVRGHQGGGRHIRSVRWNGAEWTSPTVDVRTLHEGGVWEVELGAEPVPWCTPMNARPFYAPDGVDDIELVDVVTRVEADRMPLAGGGGSERPVQAGTVVELEVAARDTSSHGLLVVGLREAGSFSFHAEAWVDGSWHPLARWRDEVWDWEAQLRPFALELPARAVALRVHWDEGSTAIRLAQFLVPQRP